MEERLKLLLEAHRYESSMGLGQRGLQPHHIDALVKDLTPFIEEEIRQAHIESMCSKANYNRPDMVKWVGKYGS